MPKPARSAEPREAFTWGGDEDWEEDDNVDDPGDDETNGDGDAGTDEQDDNDDLDPGVAKRLEKERAALYAQIVSEIAEGKTDGEIFKGLQRHLSARDLTISNLNRTLAAQAQELQQLKMQVTGVEEGIQWTGSKLIENLDPEVQEKLRGELSDKTRTREMNQLQAQLQALQNAGRESVNADPTQAAIQQAQERRNAFIQENRTLAKDMGVDPSKLDYGSDEDGVVEMQAKFSKSLLKAIGEKSDAELDSITRKREAPATRGSGGGSTSWSNKSAAELLELGASSRMPRAGSRRRGR